MYVEKPQYSLRCRWRIFRNQHKWTLCFSALVFTVLIAFGFRLRFAVECFTQAHIGFEHIRSEYLKDGRDIGLRDAIDQLYRERVISMKNVHIENMIFNFCQLSSEPRIEWRYKEGYGVTTILIFIHDPAGEYK